MDKVFIFAEIGRTPSSSGASERLLIDIQDFMKNNSKYQEITLFFYPIFYHKQFLKWLFNVRIMNHEKYLLMNSTSIKLIRDFFYIGSFLFFKFKLKPKNIYFYNLNKLQIKILFFLKIFIKLEINLIQADGYLLDKSLCSIFKNIIVFSQYSYDLYNTYKVAKIVYSYPCITFDYETKFERKKSLNPKFVHSGSISEYNISKKALDFLNKFCINNPKAEFVFTTNQRLLPNYFTKFIDSAPNNFKLYKDLSPTQLEIVLSNANFGLDLRNFDNNYKESSFCDFPSKVILYLKNNLYILSTHSISIPNEIKKKLFSIDQLEILFHQNTSIPDIKIDNILEIINKNSLDKALFNTFE